MQILKQSESHKKAAPGRPAYFQVLQVSHNLFAWRHH